MIHSSSSRERRFLIQLYLLLLSLVLFFAFIKLVNFFEAQMVIPPIFGIPKIQIVIFGIYLDSHILFITTIMLLFISRKYITQTNLTFRITILASLISLIGIASGVLKQSEATLIYIELVVSFLLVIITSTLILAPRDAQIKTTLIPSMVSYISTIIISIQLVGLCHWLKKPWGNVEPMSHGALIEYQLFMTPLFFASFLLTALIFSWLWIPIAGKIWDKYATFSTSNTVLISSAEIKAEQHIGKSRGYRGVLIFLAIISLLIGYYPYMGVDETMLVGVDSDTYYKYLAVMRESGLFSVLGMGRELHLIFLGILQFFTPRFQALRVSLSLSVLFLFTTTILLVKSEDSRWMFLSSILSIFSLTNVVGGTIGLLSNWFSLSLWYLTILLLLRYIKGRSTVLFIGANLASVAAMLSHSWTWEVLMGIIFIYEIYSFMIKRTTPYELKSVLTFLGLNGVFRFIYFYFRPGQQSFIISTSRQLARGMFQPLMIFSYFPKVWGLTSLSSQYSNFLIPALGVIGMATIIKRRNALDRMLTAWFFLCSLGVYASQIFGMVMWMPRSHAWRFLYLIPYHIPAGQGLITLMDGMKRIFPPVEKEMKWSFVRYGFMIVLTLVFSLLSSLSLLIIPVGLAVTLVQLIYRRGTPMEDAVSVTLLALFNYTLRALTTGIVFPAP